MSESVDVATLDDLVRRHLGDSARCSGIRRATVGNSQETWFVDVEGVDGTTALVLRRTAAGGTIEWSQRSTEVTALDAAAAAGLPVPAVRWWSEGTELDRPYLVLDRAPGSPPDLRRPELVATLADEMGHWLARLHRDAVLPGEWASPPTESTAAQVDMWVGRARATGLAPPLAAALCGWLVRHVPTDSSRSVLLWADPGPHNVLTDERGRITALLDWELAHGGHPMFDLGAARWACLGQLDRQRLTSAYERELGAVVDRRALSYFEVLACVTRSVMLFDGVAAALDGRADDPNVVALGLAMVTANLLRGAALAWGIELDAVAPTEAGPPTLRPTSSERSAFLARWEKLPTPGGDADVRRRRQHKIVAALRQIDDFDVGSISNSGDDAWRSFELERVGAHEPASRVSMVAGMLGERQRLAPLLALYGATTSLDDA